MFFTWVLRIAILAGAFAIHWALGAVLAVSLFFHMNRKARMYDQRYNLGGGIRGSNGKLIRAPWYRF